MKFIALFTLACSLLAGVQAGHQAGLAMSINMEGIEKSKDVLVYYLKRMLSDVHLDDMDFDFLGKYHISNIRLQNVEIPAEDIRINIIDNEFHGKVVKVTILSMGGQLSCHSSKKVLFGTEEMDFGVEVGREGFSA